MWSEQDLNFQPRFSSSRRQLIVSLVVCEASWPVPLAECAPRAELRAKVDPVDRSRHRSTCSSEMPNANVGLSFLKVVATLCLRRPDLTNGRAGSLRRDSAAIRKLPKHRCGA